MAQGNMMTTVMSSLMESPQAAAIGFAAGFAIAFLWQKMSKRNRGLGGGGFP